MFPFVTKPANVPQSDRKEASRDIPCFIVEEHHEAFFIWHYAIDRKIISPQKNTLIHVDEHADLGVPKLHTSLKEIHHNLPKIKDFIYQELHIANFIYPAFYQGIFDRFYWLRSFHDNDCVPRNLYIFSDRNQGKELKITASPSFWQNFQDCRQVAFIPITPQRRGLVSSPATVLDIDLDYFSCDNASGSYFEIEITADAYQQLATDPYHKARLVLGNLLTLKVENNKYFLCTDGEDFPVENLKLSETEIHQRIADFILFLQANQIQPCMINICRSRQSGYTPTDQWATIETQLLAQLQYLYSLQIFSQNAW